MDVKDITVIVRSVGERTEEKCIERLKNFFRTDDIHVVKNVTPFTAAIRKCYEIGLSEGKKWCLIVDADVFFYDDKLRHFIENCNRIGDKVDRGFCFQAYLYDNFFEECRLAGVHLYKTKWLDCAFPFIDNNKGRPESWVIRNMSWEGYPFYVIDTSIGIHDYFQAYKDIIAKGMLHAQKQTDIDRLVVKWEKKKQENKDFEWILKGVKLVKSISTSGIKVDADYYHKLIEDERILCPEQGVVEDRNLEEILKLTYGIEHCHEIFVSKETLTAGTILGRKLRLVRNIFVKKRDMK